MEVVKVGQSADAGAMAAMSCYHRAGLVGVTERFQSERKADSVTRRPVQP